MISFNDLLRIIFLNLKRFLVITLFGTILFGALLFFLYPVEYEAEAKLLPPPQESTTNLASLFQGMDFANVISGRLNGSSQLFAEIVKSRSAAEYVIEKLDLLEYFDAATVPEAAMELNKITNVEVTKEGIILISVPVATPLGGRFSEKNNSIKVLSAAVSNAFVEALDSLNKDKLVRRAQENRLFLEKEIAKTRTQLDSAQQALAAFQKTNKTISLPDQMKAAIQAAAEIKTEILKTEIEINYVAQNLKEDNQQVIALRSKLAQLQNEYTLLDSQNKDFFLNFGDAPGLGLRLADLTREVKVQETVYLLLEQEYYKEFLQENKTATTVDILDSAIPPLKPSSPRLLVLSLLAAIFIFLILLSRELIIQKKLQLFKITENPNV